MIEASMDGNSISSACHRIDQLQINSNNNDNYNTNNNYQQYQEQEDGQIQFTLRDNSKQKNSQNVINNQSQSEVFDAENYTEATFGQTRDTRSESFNRFQEGSSQIFALREIIFQTQNFEEALNGFSPPIMRHGKTWSNEFEKAKGVGDYKFEKVIGEGTFGKVRKAVHIKTGEHYAVKCLKKTAIQDKEHMKRVLREILIVKLLKHPNIATLYDVIDTPSEIYMIFEYASGGELFDYIVNQQRVKEKEAKRIFRQIISALSYCHKHSVIHRDLKPENILLDANLDIKIIDFGFSNLIYPGSLLETFCGSPAYAAPEMLQGNKYFGCEVDIWSIGVILYALLAGYLPFDHSTSAGLHALIMNATYQFPDFLSPESKDLISNLLKINPSDRLTLAEIWNHPWLNDGQNKPLFPSNSGTRSSQDFDEAMEDLIRKSSELNPFAEETRPFKKKPTSKEKRDRDQEKSLLNQRTGQQKLIINVPDSVLPDQSPPRQRRKFGGIKSEENIFNSSSNEKDLFPPGPILSSHHVFSSNSKHNPSSSTPSSVTSSPTSIATNDNSFVFPSSTSNSPLHSPSFASQTPMFSHHSNSHSLPYPLNSHSSSNTPSNSSSSTSFISDIKKYLQKGRRHSERPAGNASRTFFSNPLSPQRKKNQRNSEKFPTLKETNFNRKSRHSLGTDQESTLRAFQKERGFLHSPSAEMATQMSNEESEDDQNESPNLNMAHSNNSNYSFTYDTDGQIRLRVIKGIFSVDTTSTKHPNDVVEEVLRVFDENHVSYTNTEGYVFECSIPIAKEIIRWEMEVCKVQMLGLTGVIFKRRAGKLWTYKNFVGSLIRQLQI